MQRRGANGTRSSDLQTIEHRRFLRNALIRGHQDALWP